MGETTQRQMGKWAKRPGGETTRGECESGRNDSGANGKVGETTRIRYGTGGQAIPETDCRREIVGRLANCIRRIYVLEDLKMHHLDLTLNLSALHASKFIQEKN